MARLFRRKYTTTGPDGERGVQRAAKGDGRYTDENGVVQRVPLSPNKVAAGQMLNDLVQKVERKKAGLPVEALEHAKRPLAEHLTAYEQELHSRGIPGENVRQSMTRLRAVVE